MMNARLLHVDTEYGPVVGRTSSFRVDHDGVQRATRPMGVFLGIPYAAAPIGPLRWAAPVPPEKWEQPKDCSGHAAAVQTNLYDSWDFDVSSIGTSEDCLVVDVYSPAATDTSRLPVMLWVHGGAYQSGSSLLTMYHPAALADMGVVVVSIEYRVGVFGFLAHPWLTAASERGISGNYGMLDVFAASGWVRRNIARFGGDPDRVTVFGQSAGANIAASFLWSPDARGAVDSVIVESGTGDPELPVTMEVAEEWGVQLTDYLEVDSRDALLALPASHIQEGATEMFRRHGRMWAPTIDGDVFPAPVLDLFRTGRFDRLPTLFSTTGDDTPFLPEEPQLSASALTALIHENFGSAADAVLQSVGDVTLISADDRLDIMKRLVTRHQTDARARGFADALTTAGAPAWVCSWQRVPPGWESTGEGAFHSIELAYLFDALWLSSPRQSWVELDYEMASHLRRTWVQFAATGDPNAEGLTAWPPYSFDAPDGIVFGPDGVFAQRTDPALDKAFLELWHEQTSTHDGER